MSLRFLDYQVYTRCARGDYDAFAEAAGDPGWGWDSIFPYALKASFWAQNVFSASE